MPGFFESKAGKQLAALAVVGMVLWSAGFIWHVEIFEAFRDISGTSINVLFLTVLVGGLASFVYSLLRIFDLRKEMQHQQEQGRRAHWIATHDHLTRLSNRYAFDKFDIGKVARGGDDDGQQPTATVFSIDLDGFKKVNDLMGHQGGDILLQEVSKRLSAFAAESCVFRFGGDEFIVVARGLPPEKDQHFANLIIHSVSRSIKIGTIWSQVGASIGYARWPEQGEILKDVCNKSDIALYEAKSRGTHTALMFHEDMQQKVAARAQLEGQLRKAIEAGRIRPFYQPLIDLRTGDVCGFEALARWTADDGTPVSPQVFIAIAEETGLITPLFQQLLKNACQDAKLWPEHVSLSFNLSAVQMEDRLLTSRILKILDDAGLQPGRLEVEITENALIQDPDLAASIIEDLHTAGIRIALDDFGTGYSSLAQLARYRFDKIKIDKSFVKSGLDHDDKHEKIVQALLNLSRGLEIKTTVEGIEENGQLAYFVHEGCDIGQGYLFGKAMPFTETIEFLRSRDEVLRIA
ncbi:putative bifunctional diguanylate cyclase/phosphodiesterase [Pararhizobium sp.]|uniref:putative bifunctional diguanylate cyclase/phosphodiesterase n=1 Tax=Pararhizobium sp. TaxID=1977563 RepID=UPI0027220BAC|nr:EAL domain-containing protein [Pararhizobium sp.]MDO9418593.1 EAL domain-containing protein [Pararhizobium sp.]